MVNVEKVKEGLRRKSERKMIGPSDLLSTGSTLLNLACTGRIEGGFVKGNYFFLVGDSVSGKTWLTLTCLAEAAINSEFDDYRFIYDGPEGGAMMDIARFFGQSVAERLEDKHRSETLEEFYFHTADILEGKKPAIVILDSMDSLSSEVEGKKFAKRKRAHAAGKLTEAAGSYGDGKAKINSESIRRVMGPLESTGSILIIINQSRDNVGAGLFESKKRWSGGHAQKFYACYQMWTSTAKSIGREIRGKKREQGILCRIRIEKNRITGRKRTVTIPIYHSFGIDDVGSCVDYLIEENHWSKTKSGVITATGLGPGVEMKREKLIQHIEDRELVDDLRGVVGDVWVDIEKQCEVKRRKRYE
jgi:recombination protein RecA